MKNPRRFVKPILVRMGIMAVVFLAPILWSAFGTHGYFEGTRCWCGTESFFFFKHDGLYECNAGDGALAHRVWSLRPAGDGWDAVATGEPTNSVFMLMVTNGQVIAHWRLQGGDLYESFPGKTNTTCHARVYNVWLVWYARFAPNDQGRKAQKINCVNNLKQIGLGLRIWQGDHNDQSPFNLSTNLGGTLELTPAKDGYYQNPWLIVRAMSNELAATALLVCPQDRSKRVAADWASVSAVNISYQFPAGTNKIVAICPVDGNILYEDGTVVEKSSSAKSFFK